MASTLDVAAMVGDTPHMTLAQGTRISDFIVENGIRDILELGFRHGVSTVYMAAALARAGGGRITTIDLNSAMDERPSIEELLAKVGERDRVDVYYEPTSYTWRLMRLLQENPAPRFDLCYIDGAHDWFVDGFAFFLADRLLRPSGWMVFDDMDWTYGTSTALASTERVRRMPPDERSMAQVRMVYELLVKTHPGYHNFRDEGDWGFAQKRSGDPVAGERTVVKEVVIRERRVGLGGILLELARRVRR
jgi:predicted O-methyltransferase YrrM